MSSISYILYLLIGCAFALGFFANISPVQSKRMRFAGAYACIVIIYLTVGYLTSYEKTSSTKLIYFLAFGIVWPQLMSRLYLQNQVDSPIMYLNRKFNISLIIIVFAVLAFFVLTVLWPNQINYETGEGIYNAEYIQYNISFLLLVIPGGLLFFVFLLQRTAFCANGLLHQGLLFDWSNFKSYKWENDEFYQDADANSLLDKDSVIELTLYLDFKMPFAPAKFQFVIPHSDKETIEKMLKPAFPSR